MQSLTVYKIRRYVNGEEITEFEQALKDPDLLERWDIRPDLPFEGRLFLQIGEKRKPAWAAFLEEGIDVDIPKIQRVNGVLFVKIHHDYDQIFAFTFGHGRYLLQPACFEINYGLRMALNVLYDKSSGDPQPERIRSVGSKTVAENTIRTLRQTDRRATFETFGVDIQRDLLQAMTGAPISSSVWGSRISGSDSVSFNRVLSFGGLGDLCKEIAEMYLRKTYQANFGWIDNLRVIEDPAILKELQEMLVDTIKTGSNNVTVTVPEFVEWDDLSEFYFSFDPSNRFADPEDADLRGALKQAMKLEKLSVDRLRRSWRVAAVTVDGLVVKWPLLRCLTGEFKLDGSKYILSEGKFFEIRQQFLGVLNSFIASLPATKHLLPDSPGDIQEKEYNKLVAKSSDSYLLLDTKTVRVDGKTSPIEICDILTADGCFVHVKRKLGSSTLSHLFAQGLVSADLFLMSKEYRTATLERIQKEEQARANASGDPGFIGRFSTFEPDGIVSSKYEVSYAIVAKWRGRGLVQSLPFFSKVNLRRQVKDLRRMGYNVSVARVDVAMP
ncbi:MAG: TIGR04141 family sporadically distributed protein [Theionarchaea archaeon]|nr:TIGR04141 family sporadically distributed protein [Theionarchaea archaeon]